MKPLLTFVLVLLGAFGSFAQDNSIETNFEKNKLKYKLEKFSEGEDASSGYDYFFYKEKGQIVKIREIWSSLSYSTYRAEDYYFRDGELIALVKYTFPQKYYRTAEKGRNIPLKMVEKLSFTDSKLTGWIENGKTISSTDKRWAARETEALEAGKAQLENYNRLKEYN